jgi:hypothetical protein
LGRDEPLCRRSIDCCFVSGSLWYNQASSLVTNRDRKSFGSRLGVAEIHSTLVTRKYQEETAGQTHQEGRDYARLAGHDASWNGHYTVPQSMLHNALRTPPHGRLPVESPAWALHRANAERSGAAACPLRIPLLNTGATTCLGSTPRRRTAHSLSVHRPERSCQSETEPTYCIPTTKHQLSSRYSVRL